MKTTNSSQNKEMIFVSASAWGRRGAGVWAKALTIFFLLLVSESFSVPASAIEKLVVTPAKTEPGSRLRPNTPEDFAAENLLVTPDKIILDYRSLLNDPEDLTGDNPNDDGDLGLSERDEEVPIPDAAFCIFWMVLAYGIYARKRLCYDY